MKILKMILLLLGVSLFSACSTTEGCTDNAATNFNSEADDDCNCCQYESNVVFWYNQATAQALVNNGTSTLTYYVDGEIVGSGAANIYFIRTPECGSNGSITVKKKLGESKSKAYTYEVVDQDGVTVWDGVLNFDANTCLKLQLEY